MSLLTTNTKLKKSLDRGYKSFGIHLAPYKLSGKNVCTSASKGCVAACLNYSGHGAFDSVQKARINKTKLFNANKLEFMLNLVKEVETAIRRSIKNNMTPVFRLNLTSDIPWESIKIQDNKNIMEMFPNVQFYDYTKNVKRMISFTMGGMPKNYHLTFSRSEDNDEKCKIVLGMGGNVAAVFLNKLPKTYMGFKVVSGDEDDLRFLDGKGIVVGLIAKGSRGKKDESGFVIR